MNTEAIFSQIESLVDELRRKNEKKKADIKPVTWVLLPISGNEVLVCDSCYEEIKRQDMHIAVTAEGKKVVCEKCWEAKKW